MNMNFSIKKNKNIILLLILPTTLILAFWYFNSTGDKDLYESKEFFEKEVFGSLDELFSLEIACFNRTLEEGFLSAVIEVRLETKDHELELNNCSVKVEITGPITQKLVLEQRKNFDSGPIKFELNSELYGLDTFLMTDFIYHSETAFIDDLLESSFVVVFSSDQYTGKWNVAGENVVIE